MNEETDVHELLPLLPIFHYIKWFKLCLKDIPHSYFIFAPFFLVTSGWI